MAVEELREGLRDPSLHAPTLLARLYSSTRTLDQRKNAGQFFTAEHVAEWAVNVVPPKESDDVCDAGAGTAVFASALIKAAIPVRSYVGVENDPTLALCAAHVLESVDAPSAFVIWYANFLLLRPSDFRLHRLGLPSFVVSNPPFVRVHKMAGRSRLRAAVRASTGIELSPFSGAGNYFLAHASAIAGTANAEEDRDGRAPRLLFFFPLEAAGAAHARRLRADLHRIARWELHEHKIPLSQTGISKHPSNAVALCFEFRQRKGAPTPVVAPSPNGLSLGDILTVRRGISTGRNEFFVLTDRERLNREIEEVYVRPILPTRIRLAGPAFAIEDWHELRLKDEPCWLLALPNQAITTFSRPIQRYLKEGLRRGFHLTPTAKGLRNWFSIPVPSTPPDVFITYLFRGAPRFVQNRAGVFHLTNILGGRFVRASADRKSELLAVDMLNEQAKRWMAGGVAGREYKGGLRKIEPGELSRLPVDSAIAALFVADRNDVSRQKYGPLFD